ncbi:MAG: hypothetical protein ACRD68_09510, partial [Pyrinomonadaceae bacterium]
EEITAQGATLDGFGASSTSEGGANPRATRAAGPAVNAGGQGAALENLKNLLDDRRKPFLAIALEGARTARLDGEELYVEFAPEGRHLRDTLAKPDNVKILRDVCREVAGRDVGVHIVVKEAGESGGSDDAPPSKQDEELSEKRRLREMAEQHPAVQQLLKTFRAEIIDVRRVEPDGQ